MNYYSYREAQPHNTGGLPIAYYPVDEQHPKYEMIHHWHKEYEFIRVNSGWLELTLNADTFYLKAGDTALINPGVVHSAIPKNAKYECVVFDLDHNVKQYLLKSKGGKELLSGKKIIPEFVSSQNKTIGNLTDKLFDSMGSGKDGFELESFFAIAGILSTVISAGLQRSASQPSLRFAQKLEPFEAALSFLEDNYSHPITLEDIAAAAGMSRKYFCEYFKKMSGKTPVEFLNCYRIERACEKLLHTDLPVTQIALECGFNDLSYFIKTFKGQKNVTPAKYRGTNVEP